MKKLKKFFGWTVAVLLAGLIIFMLASLLPAAPHSLRIVKSSSMQPALKPGELIVIWDSGTNYAKNDIITYQAGPQKEDVVTHRIVERKEAGFVTKGDAVSVADDKMVKADKIEGKVIFNVSFLGYAVDFIKKPLGFALVVIVPATIFVYDELRKIFKEAREIRKRKNKEKQKD